MTVLAFTRPAIFALAVNLVFGCSPQGSAPSAKLPPACNIAKGAAIGGPFNLVDLTGARRDASLMAGRKTLLYFGYTYCPDVCPLALQRLGASLAALTPAERDQFQTVFITLDPERDTPDQMRTYLTSEGFPPNILGLRGTAEETAAAAKAYGITYRREEAPDSAMGYTIGHMSLIYLFDEAGQLQAFFPDSITPGEITECLRYDLNGQL